VSEADATEHIKKANQLIKAADAASWHLTHNQHLERTVELNTRIVCALAELAAVHMHMAEWEMG
jgi:hypothetical protein